MRGPTEEYQTCMDAAIEELYATVEPMVEEAKAEAEAA